jgi:hypothetical protein
MVSGRPSGAASLSLAYFLRTAQEKVREACGEIPHPARTFFVTGLAATERPMNRFVFRRAAITFGRWSLRATGRDEGKPLLWALRTCRRLAPSLSAGYAVWWDHTPGGTDWWVQLHVENDTDVEVAVDVGGSLWAAGNRMGDTDPYDEPVHRGITAAQFTWGGSSADYYNLAPHTRVKHFVGIGEFYKVHLTRDGYFFDVRPEVYVSPLRSVDGNWRCAVPVPRVN